MKPFILVTLLTGLGSAADLSLWDVDESCHPHLDQLKRAYDDAELMAVKAWNDLDLLQVGRPRFAVGRTDERYNWNRIARAVTSMFGFVPNKKGHDPEEQHWSNVMYVYDRMVQTLHEGVMVPENGYGGLKPLILCDKDRFTWVGRDDVDPHDPAGRRLHESRSHEIQSGTAGAWVYKKRYLAANSRENSAGLCADGIWASTNTGLDFIIFCPKSFGNTVNPRSALDAKQNMREGDTLDSWTHASLSRIMVHELAHWLGGSGTGGTSNRNDDFFWTINLARTHQGPNAGNSGPSKATFTADSYALSAAMSYLDEFDWADNGKAKPVTKAIPYERLPNGKRRGLG